MGDESARSTGVVARFYDAKGYGFIKPDVGGDDLFVHHLEIKSDGYRTLEDGQKVEFFVVVDGDRTKAVKVTALGGGPVKPVRRGFRSGGGGGGGRGCFKCGEEGHIARDCVGVGYGNGGGRIVECFNCHGVGHFARDCVSQVRGGGGGACFTCGQQGHLARDCKEEVFGDGGNGGGYQRSGECFNCHGQGHFARDCKVERSGNRDGSSYRSGAGGGGYLRNGGRSNDCFHCGKPGHFARECTEDS